MKLQAAFLVILAGLETVLAHGSARIMHPREIRRRQLDANARHIRARNCATEIAAFHNARKLARRSNVPVEVEMERVKRQASGTTSAFAPHWTNIQNTTCVTAPEVTEGPYYINNDLLRQDIRDGEEGLFLELDIGVIDTSTCKPLSGALVELWHANATGVYSAFTGAGNGGGALAKRSDDNLVGSFLVERQGPPGGGAPSAGKTDNSNFLRGGYQTNSNGMVAFRTVYPGYYSGRTIHIHTMVHQDIQFASNGTFISKSGSLVHIGQMFFDEALNDKVLALAPYNTNTQRRTLNSQDSILSQENSNGYNAFVDVDYLGSSITNGLLGYITVGVNSKAKYTISSNNYYEEDLALVGVSEDDTSI